MRRAGPVLVLALSGCGMLLGLDDPTLVAPPLPPDAPPRPDAPPPPDAGPPDAPPPDAPPPVHITVTVSGDGGGHVRSAALGIDCPGSCGAEVASGSQVTLVAAVNGGSTFAGWQSGCSGAAECTFSPSVDTTVEAKFTDNSSGHNFIFVTAETFPVTALTPLSAADALCAQSAATAGLPGTYVAWLSTSAVNAKDRLGSARGWVRPDGNPFADTQSDMRSGRIFFPPYLTAKGRPTEEWVATGTTDQGIADPQTCNDYTSTSGNLKAGDTRETTSNWTYFGAHDFGFPCSNKFPIYCFGTDRQKPVTVTPQPGRLAFLSTLSWQSGGGLTSADASCQTDAMSAGKSGTFKALLATSGASAASRFDAAGMPWVRVDGIPIAAPGTSPFDDGLQVPLNVTAAGSYRGFDWIATGADAPNVMGSVGSTCNDWTVNGANMALKTGLDDTLAWFGGAVQPCNLTAAVYCFQQ
jgi:hypothetical protein